ncbi:SAM-dependent methyltransferase [Rhodococcus sp. AG1013]|uniref:SAM-dependent methyltransferase n=1 Tax=unclassified Rhodococcus (in: high G+C Gram-positive bacteria) TaxID=192944 RepID=UPI000E0B8613|nr:SAM-dependent methyltransferase [Rhodococcus sp. AG1013]RDI20540.1 methyltransferase (TIGR00027 family) [Rhodococcus sp. AG1013]
MNQPRGLGATAVFVAAARALESQREDRLFDDFVIESVAGGCGPLVFLGAGLDTQAFRLRWPAPVTVYELDTADMLEFKASVVSDAAPNENATRVPIPIDLRDGWPAALHDAGFRDDVPTA